VAFSACERVGLVELVADEFAEGLHDVIETVSDSLADTLLTV
jgi:hypothetical protein